jgi:antitoxin component of RelBE/YafQ-DinJ toxin-antitoxin module
MKMGEFSIRLSSALKKDFEQLCRKENSSITDAVLAFIHYTVDRGELPFRPGNSTREWENGEKVEKLHIRIKDIKELDTFKELCSESFVSYSVAVKTFIRMCLDQQKLLYMKKKNGS